MIEELPLSDTWPEERGAAEAEMEIGPVPESSTLLLPALTLSITTLPVPLLCTSRLEAVANCSAPRARIRGQVNTSDAHGRSIMDIRAERNAMGPGEHIRPKCHRLPRRAKPGHSAHHQSSRRACCGQRATELPPAM